MLSPSFLNNRKSPRKMDSTRSLSPRRPVSPRKFSSKTMIGEPSLVNQVTSLLMKTFATVENSDEDEPGIEGV